MRKPSFRERKRRGIGAVIGTLFFIMIAIVFLATCMTIFNSFASYLHTEQAYDQQAIQNRETQVTIPTTTFTVSAPTVSTPSTVGTSTSSQANRYSFEDKLQYAQGLWWDFYSSGAAIVYRTSSDGVTWSAATTVTSSSGSTVGYTFSDWLSGTTFYYVLANLDTAATFLWRYGTLNAAGTITWTIAETSVATTQKTLGYDSITLDGSGNVWVALTTQTNGGNTHLEIWKYSGGSWAQEDSLTGLASTTSEIILPVTSGVVVIYGQGGSTTGTVNIITSATGATWSSSVSPTSQYASFQSTATSIGNTVYFVGMASGSGGSATGTLNFWTFTYGAGSTSSETVLDATSSGWYSSISQPAGTTFYVFYGSGTNLYDVYSGDLGTIWSSRQTISTTETAISGISSTDTNGGISWTSGSSSPYNVRFAFLTANTWTITPTFQNTSPFAVHLISLYMYDTNTSSLAGHFDTESSSPGVNGAFDYWTGAASLSVTLSMNWINSHYYLVTVCTDQGLQFSANFEAPV